MMNVLVCEQPGRLALARVAVPARGDDEILIRVRRVGICGTDMHIVRGTQPFLSYPRVMGHELAGVVVEAPSKSALQKGDPVFVMPYISCGHCAPCRKGLTNCCQNIQVLGVHRDGALAEYLSVPQQFVFKTEGISLDEAAMAEFLAIGAHAVRRAAIKPGERALVVGAGPIGMAAALFAHVDGARVCVVDSRADRIEFCKKHLGAHDAVLVSENLKQELAEISGGDMFDAAFDATGNAAAMSAGFDYVAHGGRYVFLSIVSDRISFSDPDFHRREMTLMASRNATLVDFERVIQAMRQGQVPTSALNTHRARLDQLVDVLPTWMQPQTGVIKGIVEC
jgi:2-desacetyl-2-hydroxyethyl bacteriochlorophyllide A dehydrogenase